MASLIAPLLKEQQNFIRMFVGPGFAFLLRKVQPANRKQAIYHLLQMADQEEYQNLEFQEGLAMLMLETVKGPKGTFHSKMNALMEACFDCMIDNDSANIAQVVEKALILQVVHARPESASILLDMVLQKLNATIEDKSNVTAIERLLLLVQILVSIRKGAKIRDRSPVIAMMKKLAPRLQSMDESILMQFYSVLSSVAQVSDLKDCVAMRPVFDEFLRWIDRPRMVLPMLHMLASSQWEHFSKLLLTATIHYLEASWSVETNDLLLSFLAHAVRSEAFDMSSPSSVVSEDHRLRFPSDKIPNYLVAIVQQEVDWQKELDMLNKMDFETTSHVSRFSAVLQVLPSIATKNQATILDSILDMFRKVVAMLAECNDADTLFAEGPKASALGLVGIAAQALRSLVKMHSPAEEKLLSLTPAILSDFLPAWKQNETVLEATFEYLQVAQIPWTAEQKETITHLLQDNLLSASAPTRLFTLQILHLVHGPSTVQGGSSQQEVISLCLEVEQVSESVGTYREKLLRLRKIENMTLLAQTLTPLFAEIFPRYCCGLLTVNFQPLWDETTRILMSLGNKMFVNQQGKQLRGSNLLWDILWSELSKFESYAKAKQVYRSLRLTEDAMDLAVDPAEEPDSTEMFSDIAFRKAAASLEHAELFFGNTAKTLTSEMIRNTIPIDGMKSYRFDPWNYFGLVMKAITSHAPSIAEFHSNDSLVPMFLNFYQQEYEALQESSVDADPAAPRVARTRLVLYLELLAKFRNPKNSIRSAEVNEQLRTIYLRFLTKNDPQIQKLALGCLATYKEEVVTIYLETLQGLVDDQKFRDTLSSLDVDPETSTIPAKLRPDLMRLIIRILFGKIISRKAGGNSESVSVGSMIARRSAILSFLAGCLTEELQFYMDLILEPFTEIRSAHCDADNGSEFQFQPVNVRAISHRKQMGYLHHLEDICKQLGTFVAPVLGHLLVVLMYLLHDAQTVLSAVDEEEITMKRAREVRTMALRRLSQIFTLQLKNQNAGAIAAPFDFDPYMKAMFTSFLSPRLALLDSENTQAPTALMDLFWCWSKSEDYVCYLAKYDDRLLPKMFACMSAVNVKSTVIARVLDIIDNILQAKRDTDPTFGFAILKPHVAPLLDNLEYLLTRSDALQIKGGELLSRDSITQRQIFILSEMAQHSENSEQLWRLLHLLLPFLKKPHRVVPEASKCDILLLMKSALPSWPEKGTKAIYETQYYAIVSQLFGLLEKRESRTVLVDIFAEIASMDTALETVCGLIIGLHAEGRTKRLDERDWDAVLATYHRLNEELYKTIQPFEWTPLLQNLLHFCQEDEISIRSNASFGIRRFLERVQMESNTGDWNNLLVHVLFPAVKRAMKSHSEIVRSEYIGILGHAVRLFADEPLLQDMRVLMGDGDEEVNFFNNICHVQMHRRTRAVRKLGEIAQRGALRSSNVLNIFMPLVGHAIFESDRKADHQLIDDSILAIGQMSSQLPWNHYYSLVRQYFRLLPKKPALEKVLIRTILAIMENFHWDMTTIDPELLKQKQMKEKEHVRVSMHPSQVPAEEEEEDHDDEAMAVDNSSQEITHEERILLILTEKILPDLFAMLSDHKNGEANLGIRVPIAIAFAKLVVLLPETITHMELPRLLTTVAQILRSRSQEIRDATRDTLVKISAILGSKYFLFVVKELSGALQRGYQLHILGYSLHALLQNFLPTTEVGEIDNCVTKIVEILLNDIFGETGAEKEVDALTSKMKETKSKRSFDSFELLGKYITFGMVERILVPIRDMMVEVNSNSFIRNVQEVFRRLVIGLNSNPAVDRVDFLIFVFQLMSKNSKMFPQEDEQRTADNFERNYKMQSFERTEKQLARKNFFQENEYLLVEFGYRLLLTALKRELFDAGNPDHVKILDPLLGVIRDGLNAKHTEIIVSALRILCILAKFKLPSMDSLLPTCLDRCLKLISRATSTTTDTVQSCFKLMTVILRDCKSKEISLKEKQLVSLITLLRPDLEESDRQNTTFSLVRAIVTRKLMAPVIYDLMDDISRIMLTSQTPQIRELCRFVLLQFLLDYPLGPRRLEKHMLFLVKNLDYTFETGRESMIEMLNSILIKFPQETLDEYSETCFLAFILRVVNEPSSKCRDMLQALIRLLLRSISLNKVDSILKIVFKWNGEGRGLALKRTYAQAIGIVVDAFAEDPDRRTWLLQQHMDSIRMDLQKSLNQTQLLLDQEIPEDQENEDAMDSDESHGWKVAYYGLNTFEKILQVYPMVLKSSSMMSVWKLAHSFLLCYHSWVRMAAGRLFGTYFAVIDSSTGLMNGEPSYLSNVETLHSLCRDFIQQLSAVELLTEEMGVQLVKNLFFLGKLYDAMDLQGKVAEPGRDAARSESEGEQDDNDDNGDDDDDNGNDNDNDDDDAEEKSKPRGLHWLVRRLSFLARREHLKSTGTLQVRAMQRILRRITSLSLLSTQ